MYIATFNSGVLEVGDPNMETIDYYGPDLTILIEGVLDDLNDDDEEYKWIEIDKDGVMGRIDIIRDVSGDLDEEEQYTIALIYEMGKVNSMKLGQMIYVE